MKNQFLYINGWVPKENFDSYYDYLHSLEFNPYEEKFQSWNKTLGEYLWDDWEYFRAPFVERWYADYEAWKIMFEKTFPYLRDNIVLGAGSLGGCFLMKYLYENTFPVKIKRIIFVAAALHDTPKERLGSFTLDKNKISTISQQVDEIVCYHSRDDDLVPFSDFEVMKTYFPNAVFREFTDKGHFYKEERLLEIEKDITREEKKEREKD